MYFSEFYYFDGLQEDFFNLWSIFSDLESFSGFCPRKGGNRVARFPLFFDYVCSFVSVFCVSGDEEGFLPPGVQILSERPRIKNPTLSFPRTGSEVQV